MTPNVTQKEAYAISNFLDSLDTDIPKISHIHNAIYDASLYKWDDAVLNAIIKGIHKIYSSK